MNVVNVVPMRSSTIPPRRPEQHVSVLTKEVVAAMQPFSGGRYVDATLGAGGHTAALLATPGVEVLGIDCDLDAIELAQRRLDRFGDRVVYYHGRFAQLREILTELDYGRVDGIVADLGISSLQLADPLRGLSFRREGPLDMRLDRRQGQTARELIDRLSVDELADVIYRFGEERRSRRVARCIKLAAAEGQLATTADLRRAVVCAVGPARIGGIDPATRTFQALRIAVNGELDQLADLLQVAPECLRVGGCLAIISFHSLEDRIVKRMLRQAGAWQPLTKKPLVPAQEERDDNPRSRSAKLRIARRVDTDTNAEGSR